MTTTAGALPRRGDIQGLRGIAVLMVIVYHAGVGLPGGFVGVDVFFVISGYVITRILLAEIEQTGRIDLGRFYTRRIRRLLPALGVMLTVVMTLGVFLSPVGGQKLSSRTGLSAALFNANTYLVRQEVDYFDPAFELNSLLHTWSLSVEEQFYLVFPVALFATWWIGTRRNRLAPRHTVALVLVAAGTISFALSFLLSFRSARGENWAFYLAPTRAWEFVVGAVLMLAAPFGARQPQALARLLGATGAVGLVTSATLLDQSVTFPGTAAVLPVSATALLILAGERGGSVTSLLQIRPLQRVGDLSYSLYLWHWPVIVFGAALAPTSDAAAPMFAIASVVPAVLSYRYIEQPLRHAPGPSLRPSLRLAAICIAAPLVSSALLAAASAGVARTDLIAQLSKHVDVGSGCDHTIGGERWPEGCAWGDETSETAVLLGDSQAGHLSEGFIEASTNLGLGATVATRSSCPFVDLTLVIGGEADDECANFVRETTADLSTESTSVFVVASASDSYIRAAGTDFLTPSGELASTPAEKTAAWTEALARTISTLRQTGAEVVVVHPTPKYDHWDPRECAAVLLLLSPEQCSATERTDVLAANRAPALHAERRAVARSGGRSLDFFDTICADTSCATASDRQWLWRDGGHISVAQSRMLTPMLEDVLAAATE